jgi:hypothetical protein
MLHFVFANKASGSTTDLTCSEQARRAATPWVNWKAACPAHEEDSGQQ